MNNDKMLPENDKDLQLARRIRLMQVSGENLSKIDDSFLSGLLRYRQIKQAQEMAVSVPGARLWNFVDEQTAPPAKSTPVYQLFSGKRAAWAAAAVLIIALTAIFYFGIWQQPTLIAQAAATIKTVKLADGSRVTLRPYSELFALDDKAEYLLNGEALFEVVSNPNREFSVEADNGRVVVFGTTFILSDWGDETRVYLEEGSVKFKSTDSGESVILQPGQSSIALSDGEVIAPKAVDSNQFTDWLQNEMVFKNTKAGVVFRELEQHYNITVTAPDSVQSLHIAGTLVLGDVERTLESLAKVIGGHFVKAGEREYQFQLVQ